MSRLGPSSVTPDDATTVISPGVGAGTTTERPATLDSSERAESFPVALRVLPALLRTHLRAVYDVARTIDDLGDDPASAPAVRTAALEAFGADMARVWGDGRPDAAVLRRLVPTVRARALSHQPFADLVEANLRDQHLTDHPTWESLLEYCALSAAPVGRTVLELVGAATPRRVALSDAVCTALQVLEHCKDVAEDRAAGRTYLPAADRARCGVDDGDLDAATASPAVRALVALNADRARALLRSGAPLVRSLGGWGRLAVAGYVAGGRAAADALGREGVDVLAHPPRTRRRDVVRHLPATLAGAPW